MASKKQFVITSNGLLVRAPAKINLSLLIAGKRPDSFHEIETIMAKVTWYDELLIREGQKKGIELVCKGPCWSPEGKENLVYRACEMVLGDCGSKAKIKITLTKNIPAGTGLGSGSSDAAATLMGVNRFLKAGLSKKKLAEMATRLGSDVAFFLDGPLAFCSGKGEKIKKLKKNFDFLALLIVPDVTSSTKRVYENYKHNSVLYQSLRTSINNHIRKNRIDLTAKMCANMLKTTCFRLYEELAELKTKIESSGIGSVCLSGSGSSMFCIVDNKDERKILEYQRELKNKIGCNSIIVSNNRW